MKRIILCLSLFAFFGSQAQQINPVPDYVFSNKMSVGRNAVTDTAAYFSIGPRYGAIRGMMPPMVTDTASMSATKRNGLLIFSIQKNKYLYWDSVGSKWAEMAGTAGSAITGSGVAGYMPEFTTSTNLDTTRLYHSAGRFAIGSTTTTNGVFNVYGGQSYFDTSLKVGSQTLLADEGKNEVYVNTTGDSGTYALQVNGKVFSNSAFYLSANTKWELTASETARLELINRNINQRLAVFDSSKYIAFGNLANSQGGNAALYVNGSANEVYVNSANDIGNYALQVTGSMYNTTGAVLAASSGSVGIGTTSPNAPLHVFPSTNDMQQVWGQYNPSGVFAYMRLHRSTSDGTFTFGTAQNGFSAIAFATSNGTNEAFTERMRIKTDGEVLINTTTDAGAYALQVAGVIYTTNDAYFGASSGRLGVGTTTPAAKITSIQSGVVTATNSAFWASHDASANPLDGIGIGTNGNSSYKWIQTYGGALSLNSAGNDVLINTTTDAGAYNLQVAGAIYNTTTITTGAPTGGSIKPWRLGEAATVSPTSPNRTIRVEIDGTVYYIHAKTTND